MVEEKAEGRWLLEGGCPASVWAEFWRVWWTGVRGISEGKGGGFSVSFRGVFSAKCGLLRWGRRARLAGDVCEIRESIWRGFESIWGSGSLR